MRFEVGRLVGNQPVGDGVGFIETITCKIVDQVKDVVGLVFRFFHPAAFDKCWVFHTALNETVTLLRHFLRDFFPDGTSQQVCMSEGESRQHLDGLHDLLLVDHHSVGFLENRFQQWVWVNHLFSTMFTLDKILNHPGSQGAWSVKGKNGNNVLEARRLHVGNQSFHARGFELEHSSGIRRTKQFESRRVIHGDATEVELFLRFTILVDQFQGAFDGGQVLKPKKIKFNGSLVLRVFHRIHRLERAFFAGADRHHFTQVLIHNDHSCRMRSEVSTQSLKFQAQIEQLLFLLTAFMGQFCEFRFFPDGLFKSDVQFIGDQLGDFVRIAVRKI